MQEDKEFNKNTMKETEQPKPFCLADNLCKCNFRVRELHVHADKIKQALARLKENIKKRFQKVREEDLVFPKPATVFMDIASVIVREELQEVMGESLCGEGK